MRGKNKEASLTTPGPDWTDIGTTLRAVERTHSATLKLSVFVDGARWSGSVAVELTATLPHLIGPGQPQRLSIYSVWPSVKAKSFEGLVYALILQMDHRIGAENYTQAELPGLSD